MTSGETNNIAATTSSTLTTASPSLSESAVDDKESNSFDPALIGGIAGGACALLIIIAIVIGVCVARRRRKDKDDKDVGSMYDEPGDDEPEPASIRTGEYASTSTARESVTQEPTGNPTGIYAAFKPTAESAEPTQVTYTSFQEVTEAPIVYDSTI